MLAEIVPAAIILSSLSPVTEMAHSSAILQDVQSALAAGAYALPQEAKDECQLVLSKLSEGSAEPSHIAWERLLMISAKHGCAEMARKLLTAGVNSETRMEGFTPLLEAALGGHLDVIRVLVESGADKNNVSVREPTGCDGKPPPAYMIGCTPLMAAAQNDHLEVFQYLVEAGADVQKADSLGRAPMNVAATVGSPEMVRILVGAGADINVEKYMGRSPLSTAAIMGYFSVVKELVAAGADVNKAWASGTSKGNLPLFSAITSGNLEIVRFLVGSGASLELPDPDDGSTPLLWAAVSGKSEIVRLLLESGADIEGVGGAKIGTPLFSACAYANFGVIRCLVESGANLSVIASGQETPLSIAACNGCVEIVEYLLQNGATDPSLTVRSFLRHALVGCHEMQLHFC